MESTIDYYNLHADQYCSETLSADMSVLQDRFVSYLQPKARILDAGCGSGRDAKSFLQRGYQVDAFDASEEMCRIAAQNTGLKVSLMRFEDLSGVEIYDGIWACASLLHVPMDKMPDVLQKIWHLLKPEGILYASFKYGIGERIKGGRLFSDYTGNSCTTLLETQGFEVLDIFVTEDVRKNRQGENWVNCFAKKVD